ncbi:MAG: type II toxin-antitoxin system RelE/ParE family toxin [Rhodobacterales bacterium]|nr:type II toxin-antitoxin system RelE/ParE family toxin [Rhodobacterales bacterium]
MAWTIEYAQSSRKPMERLDPMVRRRIRQFLSERIATLDDPRQLGGPLQDAHFAGLWRYRVGDYRILVDIQDRKVTVLVVGIGHRGEVYR